MSFGIGLTARMQSALRRGLPLYLFGQIDHPDGFVYLWTGIGSIVWEGNTYIGKGRLASIGQISNSRELNIDQRVMRLAAVNPEDLTLLTGAVRNRTATIYIGAVENGVVVADPYLLEEITMDSQSFPVDDSGMVAVQITGFAGIWTLERALSIAWTTEEAIKEYPDETGFDLIPSLIDKDTSWKKA